VNLKVWVGDFALAAEIQPEVLEDNAAYQHLMMASNGQGGDTYE
jgi:hypothetical protein